MKIEDDATTAKDTAPQTEDPGVREFDGADETPDYVAKHTWQSRHERLTCNKCQALWTETNKDLSCTIADGERALVQLGQCLATAEGKGSLGGQGLMRGAYGWSPAFQAVKELWEKLETANNRLVNIHGTIKKLEGYLLSGGRENERLEEKIRAQDKARAQMSAEYHDLVEGFARSAKEVKELRVSLEAERAANADKVQIITRQSRERRAIREAVKRGDMAELNEILFPLESDEPESVEEPEIKTVVLDVGPDRLEIVEIANVTALRAERDQLRKAIAGLREKVLAHLPCVCSQNRSVCHRHEIEETLDDFYRRAGVTEAKGPERAWDEAASKSGEGQTAKHEWIATKGFHHCICRKCGKTWNPESAGSECARIPKPCDPERIKDKLVIRFDGPPSHEPGRFVETEVNGKGVNAGEWVQDGEYWLLVIRPDVIPSKKRPGDLESRRAEYIRSLELERNRLIAKYRDTKTQILNRTPCRCLKEGVRLAEPHLPTCPSKIVMTIFDEFGE